VAILGAGIDTEWKKALNEYAVADLYRYDLSMVSEFSPILENITKAWQKFKVCYYKKNNNYLKAAIFGESAFTVNTRSREHLSLIDLDQITSLEVRKNIMHLKASDVILPNQVITKPALELNLGGDVLENVY
jgi:hypothetical protein